MLLNSAVNSPSYFFFTCQSIDMAGHSLFLETHVLLVLGMPLSLETLSNHFLLVCVACSFSSSQSLNIKMLRDFPLNLFSTFAHSCGTFVQPMVLNTADTSWILSLYLQLWTSDSHSAAAKVLRRESWALGLRIRIYWWWWWWHLSSYFAFNELNILGQAT